MRIGLFGGVFNPPHIGHLMIARQVLDFTDIDEVWFLPNFGQIPAKPGVAPVAHRLAMTRLLSLPKTSVSTIEIDNRLDGDTINLLPYLPKEHTFTFIMGADQLSGFHRWGHWKDLPGKLPFLVFPRTGYNNQPLYHNMKILEHESLIITNLSSTNIRARIQRGLPARPFVPEEIIQYINSHQLYTP